MEKIIYVIIAVRDSEHDGQTTNIKCAFTDRKKADAMIAATPSRSGDNWNYDYYIVNCVLIKNQRKRQNLYTSRNHV